MCILYLSLFYDARGEKSETIFAVSKDLCFTTVICAFVSIILLIQNHTWICFALFPNENMWKLPLYQSLTLLFLQPIKRAVATKRQIIQCELVHRDVQIWYKTCINNMCTVFAPHLTLIDLTVWVHLKMKDLSISTHPSADRKSDEVSQYNKTFPGLQCKTVLNPAPKQLK